MKTKTFLRKLEKKLVKRGVHDLDMDKKEALSVINMITCYAREAKPKLNYFDVWKFRLMLVGLKIKTGLLRLRLTMTTKGKGQILRPAGRSRKISTGQEQRARNAKRV